LLTGLAWSVADEQRQRGLRISVEQLAHQAHTEKAGCAGDQDKFFAIHAETDLSMRTTRRPAALTIGHPGDEKS
jgi:hypothetical protein